MKHSLGGALALAASFALAPKATAQESRICDTAQPISEASFDSLYYRALQRQREPEQPAPDDTAKLERSPELRNPSLVQAAMARLYPPQLLARRRGGTTQLTMIVRADGTASPVRLWKTSGDVELDLATVQVAESFRFNPGLYKGCPVNVFVIMPVTWQPGGGGDLGTNMQGADWWRP